jgi:hypothetical protein
MSNLTIKKTKRMKYAILHCFFMEKRRKRRDVHCKTKKMKGEMSINKSSQGNSKSEVRKESSSN